MKSPSYPGLIFFSYNENLNEKNRAEEFFQGVGTPIDDKKLVVILGEFHEVMNGEGEIFLDENWEEEEEDEKRSVMKEILNFLNHF